LLLIINPLMSRLLAILFLALFLGELCTHAQQPTATLTATQNTAGGVPYKTAAFSTAPGGGWQNIAQVGWGLTYSNLPANATVVATVTVTYQPVQGNTHVQTFTFTGGNTVGPTGTATGTMNGATPPTFAISFNRNPNGAPAAVPGLVCGTYTLNVAFTVNGQPGQAPQSQTGNVEFDLGVPPPLPPQTNSVSGQQKTTFPGPQQQSGGIGSLVTGRGNVVVLKRVYNPRSGTVQVIKNGIITRYGFRKFQGANPRQALRNYRRH
jgi:hypothetical protein